VREDPLRTRAQLQPRPIGHIASSGQKYRPRATEKLIGLPVALSQFGQPISPSNRRRSCWSSRPPPAWPGAASDWCSGGPTPAPLALAAVAVGALLGAGTSTAPVSDLSKAACAILIAGAGRQFRQSATGIGRAG